MFNISITARTTALEWPKSRVCLMVDKTNVKILICRILYYAGFEQNMQNLTYILEGTAFSEMINVSLKFILDK